MADTDDLHKALVNILVGRRRERGLTMDALASLAKIDRSYVRLIEKGERTMTIRVAAQIAEALGGRLSNLIRQAEEGTTEKSGRSPVAESFREEAAADMEKRTGLTMATIFKGIESCYRTLDTVDEQLVSMCIPRLGGLVELANLSSMVGNLLGAAIATASSGTFKRNGPHKYPDLLAELPHARDIEIKMGLEDNPPKGHHAKDGYYLTFRYVLADHAGNYERGKRHDVVWVWEVRFGRLSKDHDFSLSNTEGDSGKTAVIKADSLFERMSMIYYDPRLLPYANDDWYRRRSRTQ